MSGEIDEPWVRLELTSRPEAARIVRSMASAAGDALGFDPELLADVNTAVTEACNNVILHAYGDGPGPMSVELGIGRSGVEARVRDHGRGIRPEVSEQDGLKVGVALISALADRAEFVNAPDGGTEVRLSFRSPNESTRTPWPHVLQEGDGSSFSAQLHSGLNGDVVLTVSPVALLGPLLGRIGRALAPTAGFSLQRCADVYVLSDVLGAHAERAAETSSISVALGAHHHRLDFELSPLRAGTSARPQGADTLAQLTEGITFTTLDGHETLRVSMRDHLRA
jgi:anti-sigma regulatory factor (Ser/Thr protein kinase)